MGSRIWQACLCWGITSNVACLQGMVGCGVSPAARNGAGGGGGADSVEPGGGAGARHVSLGIRSRLEGDSK